MTDVPQLWKIGGSFIMKGTCLQAWRTWAPKVWVPSLGLVLELEACEKEKRNSYGSEVGEVLGV